MATISTALRKFQEPSRDDLTRLFFALPSEEPETGTSSNGNGEKSAVSKAGTPDERGEMEINAVLSLGEEGIEDSYVRAKSCCSMNFGRGADTCVCGR